MRRFKGMLITGVAMLASGVADGGYAQRPESTPVFSVTYFEVASAARDDAAKLLKQLGTASRGAPGNLRFEVLQRLERLNHFAILAAWTDLKAEDAHAAAPQTKGFRASLQPLLTSGYDERPHTGLSLGAMSSAVFAKGTAVYVLTHVDYIPPKKDEGIAALQQLAEPSRKDAGNLRYEILQQNSRPNHLTLVEIWKDQDALERHEAAAHTRAFRVSVQPMSGSLFDQRLYRTLN